MKLSIALLSALVVCLGIHAEEHDHAHHDYEHDEHEAHAHHAEHLHVPPAAQKLLGLTTVKVEPRRIRSTLSLTGRFELAPDARATAAAPVAGTVKLAVRTLQHVKKGDLLFTVASPDLRARTGELAVLEKRLAVYKGLAARNAELEAQVAVKRAEVEALGLGSENVSNGIVRVCAPVDSLIDGISLPDGAWAETGATVVALVRPDSLRFKAHATLADTARLHDGQSVEIDGHVGRLRLGLADATATLPVYVLFDKTEASWRTGLRRTAACVTDDSEKPVPAVPEECLIRLGLVPTVIIRDEDEPDAFLPITVTPGLRGNGWIAVEGLPADAEVVRDGVYELKLALGGSGGRKAGHFHADGTFHEGDDH